MAKMSESEIRKKLIQEGFWSWLFSLNKPPIVINWEVIERNVKYKIPEKTRERYKKMIIGKLYEILSTDASRVAKVSRSYDEDFEEGTTAASTGKKYSLKAKK